jgi:hypothetical protein
MRHYAAAIRSRAAAGLMPRPYAARWRDAAID